VIRINLEKGADRVTQSFIWLRYFPSSREQGFVWSELPLLSSRRTPGDEK